VGSIDIYVGAGYVSRRTSLDGLKMSRTLCAYLCCAHVGNRTKASDTTTTALVQVGLKTRPTSTLVACMDPDCSPSWAPFAQNLPASPKTMIKSIALESLPRNPIDRAEGLSLGLGVFRYKGLYSSSSSSDSMAYLDGAPSASGSKS